MGIVFSTVLIFYGIIFLIGRFTVDAVKQAPKRAISRRDADKIIKYFENCERWYREFEPSDRKSYEFRNKYYSDKDFQGQVLNRVCEILDSIGATYDNLPAREALRVWDTIPHRNYSSSYFPEKDSISLIRDVWFLDHGMISSHTRIHGFSGWFGVPKFEAKCDSSKFYSWALKKLADYGFDEAELDDIPGIGGVKRIRALGETPRTSLTPSKSLALRGDELKSAYVAIKNGDVKIY